MEERASGTGPVGRPRIEDVAVLAGTSPMTVSRALRQPGKVAPETLARIRAAVDALGYIPDLSASSLASRRSGILAVLVPTIGNSVFSETVRGVTDAIEGADQQLLIGDFTYSEEKRRELVRALIGRRPDALVIVGAVQDEVVRTALRRQAIPVVETWELGSDPIDMMVGFSNFDVGAAVARHLAGRGRRRGAFIGGTESRAMARRAGFRAAWAEAGLGTPEDEVPTDLSIEAGRQAFIELLARAPDIDGVFFATDVMAVGGLLECQRRGIAVPDEVAIVGLGNLEIGRQMQPALTTVEIPAYAMGRRAGDLILARLAKGAGPAAERIIDLGFSLLVRGTS
ncbi:LacI family transcriptional regulator [Aliidongia dinghuensis]|uniref:LacI family transcriptional regulator n=1 Tax=Aliidongia dinghuensis TaxID=1867774 RepID=A0A8J3E4X9_9PROT|nr:LacI family DNA-binding transcriptional regulator [Aliidongia dinghuensis]GGF17957.1 LacI family transcriptional regulator [Aliidongia dinghuensis]